VTRRRALKFALALTMAHPSLANAGAPAAAPRRVFISPAGEPFRPGAAQPEGFEAWFARVDANHDGRIERAEFRADFERYFRTLDVNQDGVIDGFEIAAYEKTLAPELSARVENPRSAGAVGIQTVSLLPDPEPVSSADRALDSRVTLKEWIMAADRRFDLLDKEGLGYLTRESLLARLPKAHKARQP
jgi:Ca2+-binding EF-hand superfamily protein